MGREAEVEGGGGERGEGEREEGSMLRAEPVPVGLDFDDVSKARRTN